MAAAKHIGRVLLTPGTSSTSPAFAVRKESAYLVTGGMSGLGRLTVEWLARKGAGFVLALGRRPADVETQASFSRLREKGTVILAVTCDVSHRDDLLRAIEMIPDSFTLRGVFHAAGVLDDAGIFQQRPDRFRAVMNPKVSGAWNLHLLTRHIPLDCFVLYSSAAGVFGARGQANHAAANACLDALAMYRRQHLGLTALSIDWGAWSGTGAAVRHSVLERNERAGVRSISPADGFSILEQLLQTDHAQVLVTSVNWQEWAKNSSASAAANADLLATVLHTSRSGATAPRISEGSSFDSSTGASRPGQAGWLEKFLSTPREQRRALLESRVEDRLRTVLSLPSDQLIDPARPLQEYGLDSLLSIELRNALAADLEKRLPSTALFDYPTLASLTNWLFQDVLQQGVFQDRTNAESNRQADLLEDVATLSEDDVERLFQQRMAGIRQ